ncbi:hypothetical protein [Nesterenkonia sp. CF4.4]|uniref:hypothetical protein n=1 Tax=Nesterenkonia sp. CF4.4 TaxID=3373079 RepID=UPI003EE58640
MTIMNDRSLPRNPDAESPGGLSVAEAKRVLADMNHLAIEKLYVQVAKAFKESGRTIAEVAKIVDIAPDLAHDIVTNQYELTTGELQEVLFSLDAVIDVKIYTRAIESIAKEWKVRRVAASVSSWQDHHELKQSSWHWVLRQEESKLSEGHNHAHGSHS